MLHGTAHHRVVIACAMLALLSLLAQPSFAQGSGVVRGRVLDRDTGEPLPGANVLVENTSIGAATDLDGKFLLSKVPAGRQSLRVTYVGYVTMTRPVTVTDNGTTDQEFRLTAQAITGETVIVTAQAQGQNAAINQQLSSNTITSVVSSARIKELPDVNAAESIGRLPGVSINRSGGEATTVAIRGLSAKYNVVTVNGVRLPATGDDRGVSLTSSVSNNGSPDARFGGNDRSADLSLISSNMLDGIELKKANTPDMDADVLGGTVDLKLKEAPEELQINLSAQGGYNRLQKYYGNYNFSGSISNRFLDGTLGVIASANVDDYDRSADKFSGSYRQVGLNGGVISSLNLREEKVKRGRTGASALLDYRIPNGSVNSLIFYDRQHWDGLYRMNVMSVDANRHYYDLENRHGINDIWTGSLGMRQDHDWIRFDVTVNRTGSRGKNPNERTWRFAQENTSFNITPDSTTPPTAIPPAALIDSNRTALADIFIFDTKRNENQTSLQANIEMPFAFGDVVSGSFKFGGKLRWLDRMNDEEVNGINNMQYGGSTGLNQQMASLLRTMSTMFPDEWNWVRDSTLTRRYGMMPITRFLSGYSRNNFLDNQYPLGFPLDEGVLSRVTDALIQTPSVIQRYTVQSMGRDYDGIEHYQAGYLMATVNLGEYITLLPGVRYERDYSRYHGQQYRAVTIGGARQSAPLDLTPVTAIRNNEYWLPSVSLTVKPIEGLKVMLVRWESLTRPDYRQYAPITYITAMQDQIVAANLALRPAHSTNYDAAVMVFNNSIGLFTVSGFYKRIKDMIFSSRYDLAPGIPAPAGSSIPASWLAANAPIYSYSFNNPRPATIKGFELEWQTHFWYLPSVLQGLVLSVNYTRIFSEVEIQQYYTRKIQYSVRPPAFRYQIIDSSRTARVPDQPAHIANVTVGYDYKGFSARLSYLYQTDRVSGIDRNPSLDSFTGTYARWDLTLQQAIPWGIQVFANFANLNSRPDETFRGYQMINPTYIEYYGLTIDLGVRYRF